MSANVDKNGTSLTSNYIIYILLALLTLVMTWSTLVSSKNTDILQSLPDKFVRLERYQRDIDTTTLRMDRIESKLDKLIDKKLIDKAP